jgi:hypothetical protein
MAGVFLCEAWLNKAWAEVRDAREKGEHERHLAKGTRKNPQPPGAKCPSHEPFGVCCPCVDENSSSQMQAKRGAGLLMVPPNLGPNTLREMDLQIDRDNPRIKMRILNQLTPARSNKDRYIRMGPRDKRTSVTEFVARPEDVKFLQDHPDSPGLAQYVVLCSRESWVEQVEKKGLDDVRYGRFFRDEFHLESGDKTLWIRYLKSLNAGKAQPWGRPFSWLASGTPCEEGPRSLIGAMELLMYQQGVDDDVFWKKYTPERLKVLHSDLKAYLNNDSADEETDDDAQRGDDPPEPDDQKVREWNELNQHLMIQRGRGSTWSGQRVVPLPRVRYREVEVQNSDAMDRMARQIHASLSKAEAAKIRGPTDLFKSPIYNLSRMCATFPRLAMPKYRRWAIEDSRGNKKEVNLTTVKGLESAGLSTKENMLDRRKNPILRDIESIVDFSPKMTYIRTILDQMGDDYRGAPGQAILFTYSPLTAMVLFLVSELLSLWYLSKHVPFYLG